MRRPTKFDLALRLGLLLIFVFAVEQAGEPLTTLGPQQIVVTDNPKAGVHTRLTDEGAPWKIQRNLQMVREMGAPWIVEFFPWAYIEYGKNAFDWWHTDQVIDHARAQGLTVIARLGLVPAWARPDPHEQETTFNYLDQSHYDDFGDFVYAFVDRYKDRVDHIIIWNEPNLSFEWGMRPVDAQAYVDLLKVAYRRAKEANPNVVVLAGALAPTLEPQGSPGGLNDLIYLQQMYDAGAKDYFDALAAHAYGIRAPINEAPDPSRVNFRRIELLRDIMTKNGDGEKPMYITEAGWNDSPRWNQAVTPAQRIENTLKALDWVKDKDWIKVLALWVFSYPQATHTFSDNWTFLTDDLRPKPIYDEVKKQLTISNDP
ncbi:MAG TPA: glycosyl hydrolase [Anaerolineae bacterium]|nr:glycosyl hydrolase [Anaerolineae bacterium]